jgi:cytochrome P450
MIKATCSAYVLQRLQSINSLPDEQLVVTGTDLLLPAASAVSTTLNFAFAFLVNYPEVQTKMQQELDNVVGRDRLPNLDDRARSVETSVLIENIIRNRAMLT